MAAILNAATLIILAGAVGYTIVFGVIAPQRLARLFLIAPLFALLAALLAVIRAGRVRLASGLLIAGLWLVLLYVSALNGGVFASAYSGYTVVVLIAGLLLGRRVALWTAAASILAGLVLVFFASDLPAQEKFYSPLSYWIGQATFFVVAALLLQLAVDNIRDSLARAQKEITERRRLEDSERRRRASLEKVVQLGKKVSQASDWGGCLRNIAVCVREGLGFDRAALFLYDQAAGQVYGAFGTDREGRLEERWREPPVRVAIPSDLAEALRGPGGLRVTADFTAAYNIPPESKMYGVRQHALCAIWAGDAPIGVLAVDNVVSGRQMGDDQLEALGLFAGYAGLAIQNARLLAETNEALAREKHVNDVARSISGAYQLSDLLEGLVRRTAAVAGADAAWLGLVSDDGGSFAQAYDFNFPVALAQGPRPRGQGLSWLIAETGQSVLLPDYPSHPQALPDWVSAGARAYLGVPLPSPERVLGVMGLISFTAGHIFTDRDLALVEVIARQAGIAIQNVRLLEETRRRAEQLAIVNEVSRVVSTRRDLPGVLEAIYQQVQRSLALDTFYIALYDSEREELTFPITYDEGRRWQESVSPLAPNTNIRRVIATGQPVLINRTQAEIDQAASGLHIGNPRRSSASLIFAPLVSGEQVIGVLSAQSYSINTYNGEHLTLLAGIGHQIAIAIETARLFEAERQRLGLLTALFETSLDVNAQLELPNLLQTVVERSVALFKVPIGGLYLVLPDGEMLEVVASVPRSYQGQRIRKGEGLAGRIAQTAQPLIVNDYANWEGRAAVYAGEANLRSVLGVPVKVRSEVLGVLDLVDPQPRRFRHTDIESVQLLAAQAAVAIQNARLFTAAQRQLTELRVLGAVAAVATEALDEDELIARTTAIVGEALFQDYCGILLVDQSARVLRVHPSHRGMAEAMKKTLIPLGQGITGQVAATAQACRLPDVRLAANYLSANPAMRSELCVPLKASDQVIGVLNVESPALNAFSDSDEHLLSTLAGQLAPAIERLRAEAQVRRLNADLERRVAERTAQLEAAVKELEAFSYSVSHDLRTPLRSIDGFSQALFEDYYDRLGEDGRRHLQIVRQECQHMGQLIDDLINLARVSRAAMSMEKVDLSALAEMLLNDLRSRHPEREVQWDVAPGLQAAGDYNLVRILMDNLLNNAWKFTSRRGDARIEVGRQPLADGVRAFYVRDNGAGFDMAFAGKLFGAFQRLHSHVEFEGTGIGLATVLRIINRHGGRVWAESKVERGATFYFTLPELD